MLNDETDSRSNFEAGGKGQHGGAVVPQYSPQNRMLMRSPLPSPTSVRKKKVVHVARNNTGSDSEDGGYKKREEAHISRLVHMAKAQQNLMTAWFAASAGEEDMIIPLPPRRKSSRRKSSDSSSSSSIKSDSSSRSIGDSSARSSASSGPIDLDSGAEWDEENSKFTKGGDSSHDDTMSLSSQSSSTSSKMKAFLTGIISGGGMSNSASSILSDRSPPSMIGVEGTNPTTSYDAEEAPPPKSTMSFCGREWSRNRIVLGLLVLIFGVALITVLASSLGMKDGGSGQQQASLSNEINKADDGLVIDSPPLKLNFPTSFPTTVISTTPSSIPSKSSSPSTLSPSTPPSISPTMTPSQHPSFSPSSLPSIAPSITPTNVPSFEPSVTPSTSPTAAPSMTPTTLPSSRPSQSQLPSWSPSSSPSTVFSTTVFEQALVISGDTPQEEFGYGVAMNGPANVIAVGARYHGPEKQGSVQVYQFISGEWIPKGPSIHGRHAQDQFGWSVALNDDGNILAVSEPGFDTEAGFRAGNVRVFVWNNKDDWTLLGGEIPGEGVAGLSGVSLSLSKDGTRLAVGSPLEDTSDQQRQGGRVRIYELQFDNSVWRRQDSETDHSIDWSDWSNDLQLQINNATWQPLGQPLEGNDRVDWFGWSIDLQGDDIAVGAPRNRQYGGYVRIFHWNHEDDEWTQVGSDINNDLPGSNEQDRFGMSVSLHANRVAIGAPWKDVAGASNVGLVAVYTYDGDEDWILTGTPIIGDEPLLQLGLSVCLRKEEYLTVGAPGGPTGRVGLYRWDGQSWDPNSLSLYGEYPKEDFGHLVVTNEDFTKILVGSPATTAQGYPGSVRVFERGQD